MNQRASFSYEASKNRLETEIINDLRESGIANAVIDFINEKFLLSEPVYFLFGGEDGPLFDSEKKTIYIPYFFLDEVKARFLQDNYSSTGVSEEDATMDALMHTMFHEFAHAIIFMYELPVLGREEDAADSLATLLLIEYFDQGQDIAISAADLFDLESNDIQQFNEEDFKGEHGLDAQRYYSILCHVYGSDSKKYAYFVKDGIFDKDRAELCEIEYQDLNRNWFKILKPYMK